MALLPSLDVEHLSYPTPYQVKSFQVSYNERPNLRHSSITNPSFRICWNRSRTLHSLYSEQSILQLTIQIMKALIQTLFLGTVAATIVYAPSVAYVVV